MIRLVWLCCFFYGVKTAAQPLPEPFIAGRTTGELPHFDYGLGTDRLGGAKMTYLDSAVLVKVIDSTKDVYKVRLSQYHVAWLPKANFRYDSAVSVKPYYLTESWKVYGDEKYDYVTIKLDERLPYRSIQEVSPSKIVVDIFGATSNTNWITQLTSAKEIKNAYYEQVEDDVFRAVIELKHQHWGYSIFYEDTKMIIRVNRQPPLTLAKLKIAIDPGHGGDNLGADGVATGILEKDYTLKFARELQKALKKEKATVFMTRIKDTTLTMPERTQMLKEAAPDLLISIHLNSSGDPTIKGASTYYRYIGFRPLTQYVLKRLLETGLEEFGNVGSFNFGLNGPTDYPNCLVEVAFLSNRADEKRIRSAAFQKLVAAKIVAGIKDWLVKMKS